MRPVAVVCVLACVLVVSAGSASAHGNHLSADDQYSNGTVVVETMFTSTDGFVVLHTNDGGEPGKPIGHAPVEYGYSTGVTVNVSEKFWSAQQGTTTVWAVIYTDDGDGKFEPGQDEQALSFGGEAQERFIVGKREAGPAHIVADGFSSQETNGSVTVERVALGHDGAVVVRADKNDAPGRIVGRTSLSAGVHENVTVELNRSHYRTQDARFSLWASLEERGSPVRLDGSLVASEFSVRKTDDASAGQTGDSTAPTSTETGGISDMVGPGFGVAIGALAFALTALARRRWS